MRGLALLLPALLLTGCTGPDEAGGESLTQGALGERVVAAGDTVTLSVPGGGVRDGRYVWDFGDGESALGARVTHAWETAGRYVVAVQRFEGETILGAATGFVFVNSLLALEGLASTATGPSEVRFAVGGNATAVRLEVEGEGDGSGVIVLADATGARVLEQAFETEGDELRMVLETTDTDEEGEWILLVEAQEGELDWRASGTVHYEPQP